jgi:microcystin-dependent protein
MFYMANGSVHVRLTDSSGNVQYDNPSVLVIGASSGSGGGAGVDPTTLVSTGDLKFKYGTGTLSGYVRANGLTIGNATSGATERANADTQALFIFLYGADPNLVVSGGRTGNALNDYNANKTIALPDARGRVLSALDDMGAANSSRLATVFSGTDTTLGAAGGGQNQTISVAQIPAHQHNVYLKDPGHAHAAHVPAANNLAGAPNFSGPTGANLMAAGAATSIGNTDSATTGMTIGSVNGVANDNLTASVGGGNPVTTVQPTLLATLYIKL